MELIFVYAVEFDRLAEGLLTDEQMRLVEQQLLANPRVGPVVPGTGGVRKLRVALPGRGKSGSARIIYLYVAIADRVYFLTVYTKSARADLTAAQKQQMRALVAALRAAHEREHGR